MLEISSHSYERTELYIVFFVIDEMIKTISQAGYLVKKGSKEGRR